MRSFDGLHFFFFFFGGLLYFPKLGYSLTLCLSIYSDEQASNSS